MKRVLTAAVLTLACTSAARAQKLMEATAINEVFGDGAKITTVALTYDKAVDGLRLSTADFKVDGREVTAVYTCRSATRPKEAVQASPCVAVKLKTQTEMKPVMPDEAQGKAKGPVAGRVGMGGNGSKNDKPLGNDSVRVAQVRTIYTDRGKKIKAVPAGGIMARSDRTLVADDFRQSVFHDSATGIGLKYNLYTPKGMKPGERYPLILFIHDASGAGKDVRNCLLQGNGATVWASPEWQATYPCFVLAPQFAQVTVDDDFHTTPDLDACLHLIDSLVDSNPVDTTRIYTTGQSMGCMSSYVLMLRRPELFASAMLVAGQWDPSVLAPLAHKNLWLLSCKGDLKSSAGVAAAIKVWEQNGGKVVEQEWPLQATAAQRRAEVDSMLAAGGNIHYTHFAGGSHNNTWRVAYYIDGIRKWLFRQRK